MVTNMLETLVLAHCEQQWLHAPSTKASQSKGADE